MKKILILTILGGILFGCGGGYYGSYRPRQIDFGPDPIYSQDVPEFYLRERKTTWEQNQDEDRQVLERRLDRLERFRDGWMERNSPYGRNLLTGSRPSYGESLLK